MGFMDLFRVPKLPGTISGNVVFVIRMPRYKMESIADAIDFQTKCIVNNVRYYDTESGYLVVVLATENPDIVGRRICKLLTNACYRFTWAKVMDDMWKLSSSRILEEVEIYTSKNVLDIYYGDDSCDPFDAMNHHMKIRKEEVS